MSESSSLPCTSGSPLPSPTLAEDILNAIETLVCVVNGDRNLLYVSPAVKRILGYEVAEVLGAAWWEKVYSKDLELGQAIRARVRRAARGDTPIYPDPHPVRAFNASGEPRWLVWRDAKGPGELMIGVGQDITELLKAERMAEQREQEFTAVFQNASDGMLIVNNNWAYEQVNDAACRIFGLTREEVVGKTFGSVLPANIDFLEVRERALRDGSARVEATFKRRNGESTELELSVTPYRPGHHLVVQRDVTEQRKLQSQLSQAHRLEAVGRLAGGVAHDFNNMLTAIRGYADLLQRSVTEDKHKRYIDAIQGAATRAAAMTQHLLAFSRKQMLKPQVIEINQAVNDTVTLLQRLIGEDINLMLLLSPEAGKIVVDPVQFGQVLMNLAVNSRDAMQNGGKLIIETQSVQLHEQRIEKQVHIPPGHYSLLSMTDTGTGIPPAIMSHIFEPFFTTKQVGKGTGLGLATVYGTVTQSGGYVCVYSEPGHGSTFKIYFPCVDQENALETATKKATILVIEDDETSRVATVKSLEEDGYRVLPAGDAAEALTVCQQWSDAIDVVLTDVVSSGISHEDLMGYFGVKYPNLAMVDTSGFTREEVKPHTLFANALFLAKPFTPAQLRETIEQALRRNQTSSANAAGV